eukprot:351334-Chlamydomonas_euryale.AAC.2
MYPPTHPYHFPHLVELVRLVIAREYRLPDKQLCKDAPDRPTDRGGGTCGEQHAYVNRKRRGRKRGREVSVKYAADRSAGGRGKAGGRATRMRTQNVLQQVA